MNTSTNLNPNSSTSELPTTRNAFRRTTTGSNYYFTIIEANARSLLYGSFFGSDTPPLAANERGDHLDGGTCRFDKKGVIYHAACVCKADDFVSFPLKNATSPTHNSTNCNLAAFKFEIDALVADFTYQDEKGSFQNTYCSNVMLQFDNSSRNANTYEWFVNDTLISRQNEPTYKFAKNGSYDVKLVAYNNTLCIKSDSTVKKITIIDFDPHVTADTSICPKAQIELFASGGENYVWSENVGFGNSTRSNFTLRPNATDSYAVEISKGICKVTLPVKVTVSDEKPDFNLTAGREVCLGDSVILSISGKFESFRWEYNDTVDSTNRQITVSPTATTTYQVSTSYKDGCKPVKASTLRIDKSYTPTFSTRFTPICNSKSLLTFENNTQNSVGFLWDFGNGKQSTNQTPTEDIFSESGTYVITLEAKNETGCSLLITEEFNYNPWDGQVPNVITPNGDGKNDLLVIGTTAALRIYNRWGKPVYSNEEYDNSWGKNVKTGTYFYELMLPDKSTCKGYIDVIN